MFFSTWTPITRPVDKTLGARELDVVLPHRFAHPGAGQAHRQRDFQQRQIEGRQQHMRQAVAGEKTAFDPQEHRGIAAPVDGSQPRITANTMMNISPTQKVGRENPRIDPAMIARDSEGLGEQAGIEPQRNADDDGQEQGAVKASSSVAGMWCRISFRAGSPNTKERPRSPCRAPSRKRRYCSQTGLSSPRRSMVRLDLRLVGVRADQHVDRVADHVDAEENDNRHQGDDDHRLHQAPDDKDGHGHGAVCSRKERGRVNAVSNGPRPGRLSSTPSPRRWPACTRRSARYSAGPSSRPRC